MRLIFLVLYFTLPTLSPPNSMFMGTSTILKNKMTVEWSYQNDRIHFTLTAPCEGWVAIGFNPGEGLTGTNLIMGNVIDGKATVEDFYVLKPGDYRPVAQLEGKSQVSDVVGETANGITKVRFTLPVNYADQHHHPLQPGTSYQLLMAYSLEDDFQHHSIMRTSTKIIL